jgi:hypothetical protein
MAIALRQSTASQEVLLGPFLDDTDGKTAETGLTIANTDIKVWKNGGTTEASKNSGGATHIASGRYYAVMDATDTDTCGPLELNIHVSGALPVRRECHVYEEAVYDELFGASALGYIANAPVNVAQISGDSTAADNLENAYDDTAGAVPWAGIIDQGTAQSATGTTLVLRSAAAFADDTLIATTLGAFGSTQGYWQFRVITDNVSATDTVTVDAWTVTPSGTITYKIFGTAPATAGDTIDVNVVSISGDTTAADNAEAFFDGTGYAGTNNVIPLVTTTTTATNVTTVNGLAANVITATAIQNDAITAAKIATGAIDADAIADNAIDAGAIASDAITAAKIADGAIDANTFAAGAITASAIAADAIGASELAADAVAEIADAIWDEALSGHTTAGTAGKALSDAGAAGDPWGTALPGAYGAGTAGKILGDNLNATVSSRASQTSVDTVDDFLDTEIAAIKAKTDNLPSDPADASDIASAFTTVNTKLDTIDDFLDTEAAAILAAVDTEVAAILALLDDARTEPGQGAPPVNPDLATKIDYLYKAWRNKKDNDGAVTKLYADNGTTVDHKQNTSESGGTVTKAEWITGA